MNPSKLWFQRTDTITEWQNCIVYARVVDLSLFED